MIKILFRGLVLLYATASMYANASHFRYASISYTVPDPVNDPLTIELTVTTGWRLSFIGLADIEWGDNSFNHFIHNNDWDTIGTVTSPSGDIFVGTKTISHTYASPGRYQVGFRDCCRVSDILNNDTYYYVYATVDLTNPSFVSNPTIALPPYLQMVNNQMNVLDLTPYITHNDPYWCQENFLAGTSIAQPAQASGFQVTNDCKLVWDLTGFTLMENLAVPMLISTLGGVTPVDFTIGVVSGPGTTCPPNDPLSYSVARGASVTVDFTVDQDSVAPMPHPLVQEGTVNVLGPGAVTTTASPTESLPQIYTYAFDLPANTAIGAEEKVVITWNFLGKYCSQTVSITATDGSLSPRLVNTKGSRTDITFLTNKGYSRLYSMYA